MKAKYIINLTEDFDKQEFSIDIISYFTKKFKAVGCNIFYKTRLFPIVTIPHYIENLYLNTVDNNYDMCYNYLLNLKSALKNPSLSFNLYNTYNRLDILFNHLPYGVYPLNFPLILIESTPVEDQNNNFKTKIETIISFTPEFRQFLEKTNEVGIKSYFKSSSKRKRFEIDVIIDDLKKEIKKRIDLIVRAVRLTEFGEIKL